MSPPPSAAARPVRGLVLAGYGINCEEETAAALRLAGATPVVAHLGELLAGAASVDGYDLLVLPGGFSFGDELGAGKVLANLLRFRRDAHGRTLLSCFERHLAAGGLVIGICNGFQALVRLGLLPNTRGSLEQEVALGGNDSGRFEDRWVECVVDSRARTAVFDGIDRLRLPVRHGEGKLVVRDDAVAQAIESEGLCCLRYAGEDGQPTGAYPANPNGSAFACAGLTDRSGQVLGMMPHPEAFLSLLNDPAWPTRRRTEPIDASADGDGLRLFRNIVRYCTGRWLERPVHPAPSREGGAT